jgi:predicted nuclease with TOPRIM domain
MGRLPSFDREDEVKDSLIDCLKEILEEASPLLPKETLKKEAKERSERAYDFIRDQLEASQKEKEELIEEGKQGRDELEEKKKEINELYEKISNLEDKVVTLLLKHEETEELLLKAAPGTYHSRRYGV